MSGEQLIPNAVGRLDDVVEALAAGDAKKAKELLFERAKAISRKAAVAGEEYDKANRERDAVVFFGFKITSDPDFVERVRLACGGGKEVIIDVPAYDMGLPAERLEELGPGL